MFSTSILKLSKSALRNNLAFLKKTYGPDVIISSVIKGNAYGHSIEKFVPLAEECGIRHFSVFSSDEALRTFRETTFNSRIMIMGMIDDAELEWAIHHGIEFYVFEPERLEMAIKAAKRMEKQAKVHIEVETGMNRTGFNRKNIGKIIDYIKSNREYVSLEGLCTHYAGAESIANYVRIKNQIKTYNRFYKKFVNSDLKPKLRHTACSAASISYPQTRMDMVRIGIMQYGFWPSGETKINYLSHKADKNDPLQRVISWKSKVMNVKKVRTGEFIGYGTSFLAQEDITIAAIPVGYAHGFSRSLSNHGRVLVDGYRVSVIGVVNMNMMLLNVTEIPHIKKGDEVILIGEQNGLTITVASFSEFSNLLNYELLTRLPQTIPRVVIN